MTAVHDKTTRTARLHLGLSPADSHIEVDGRELSGVTDVHVHADVNHAPTLELDLRCYEIDIDGEMQVQIPDATRDTLIALGWTPPADTDA